MISTKRLMKGLLALTLLTTVTLDASAADGERVYGKSCRMCHSTGMMGAPKTGDATAWRPRIEARDRDTMVAGTIKGFGRMMPRGGCRKCSDDEIAAAVDYMLSKVE